MRFALISVVAGVLAFGAFSKVAEAQGQGTPYVWDNQYNGEPVEDRSWCNPHNWENDDSYPNSSGHTVTIGNLPQGEGYEFPVLDCEDPITVGFLTINGGSSQKPELTFEDAEDPRVLIITGTNGLNVSHAWFDILMQDNAVLRLDGGGTAILEGPIVFDNAGTTPPKFMLGDGTNLTVEGNSGGLAFQAFSRALITGQVGSPDDAEVLVLSSSARMCGAFDIDVILVNNGRVHTSTDCAELSPEVREGPKTINLLCHPKGGSGNWLVDGGYLDGETIVESKLKVDTGLASTGGLFVWQYGWAIFSRTGTFPVDTVTGGFSGGFMMRPGGTLRVKKNLVFDARRWDVGCSESS